MPDLGANGFDGLEPAFAFQRYGNGAYRASHRRYRKAAVRPWAPTTRAKTSPAGRFSTIQSIFNAASNRSGEISCNESKLFFCTSASFRMVSEPGETNCWKASSIFFRNLVHLLEIQGEFGPVLQNGLEGIDPPPASSVAQQECQIPMQLASAGAGHGDRDSGEIVLDRRFSNDEFFGFLTFFAQSLFP